ncbi:MAG: DUF7301 family protein [Plesiomonas shigelloides]
MNRDCCSKKGDFRNLIRSDIREYNARLSRYMDCCNEKFKYKGNYRRDRVLGRLVDLEMNGRPMSILSIAIG